MSTNKKFRIQNGADIHGGGLSIDDVVVIGADGKVVPAAIADAVAGLTSSDIADLQAQVSAILGTSPETLDTLQEIVAAFEAADTTLTGTVAQNAADIATINTTLTNGVATPTDVADLQSQVTSNDSDIAANAAAIAATNARTAGVSTSSGSSNIQMAAEVDMDSNKVTNMADPTAAQDAATKAYVDAASSTSSSGLATETAARIAGDTANSGEVVAAEARLNQGHSADADFSGVSAQGYNIQSGSGYNVDITAGNDFIVNAADDVDLVADDAAYITSGGKIDLQAGSYIEMDGDTYIKTGHSFRLQDDYNGDNPAMMSFIQDVGLAWGSPTAVPSASAVYSFTNQKKEEAEDAAQAFDSDHWVGTAKPYVDAGDATVQAAVDVVSGRVDAILNGAGESLDTIVEIVAAFEDADSDLQAVITANSTGLSAEVTRATTAEGVLQSNIDALTSSTGTDVSGLQSQIDAEEAARIAGDSDLTAALAAETAARISADAALASDIVSETTLVAGDGISVDNLTHTVALDGSALSQNLVPSADNTYTLGSPDKVWKDVYIGPGSLYIGGQKVIEDNSGTITINADPNQNLTVQTTGTGGLNVQSTGSGGVSIDAASESVQVKSDMVVSVGKTISTVGGAATKFGGDIDMQTNTVSGLGAPSMDADAATKLYVDDRIAESTISGGKTFADDVIISGNLTVSGTTTTVNSETISLADNIIDLNSNLTSGAPSEDAGIRIMRGDASAVQLRWNETSDHWETYNGSAWTKIALDTDDLAEGSTNKYFTDARVKACLSGGLCITYNSTTGEIAVDETEAESSLRVAESVASDDADKLDGQEGTYYRINVYNVAGTLVN